jgi:hypothetical protein
MGTEFAFASHIAAQQGFETHHYEGVPGNKPRLTAANPP